MRVNKQSLIAARDEFTAKAAAMVKKLSPREQLLVVGAGLLFVVVIVSFFFRLGAEAFSRQRAQLEEAQKNAVIATQLLQRYVRLKARKEEIEREYQQVEMKEGPLAYLENLVREQAGVASGFTIKDSPAQPFGHAYEQVPFKIRFSITSVEKLVAFLKEIVDGPKPFIVSKLDIINRGVTNRLDVEVDVSSIRRTGPGSGEKTAPTEPPEATEES